MERGIAGETGVYYGKGAWESMPDKLLIIYWAEYFNKELEITD